MKIGYVNVFVSDIEQSKRFFEDSIGLTCQVADTSHGYASFNAGPISFGTAQTDEAGKTGRFTGIGFVVDDIDQIYTELLAKGVEFDLPPTTQPWGGVLALFKDPDDNVFYLDPGMPH